MSIDQRISALVTEHFPSFYKEEGPQFVAFIQAYYEWMESEGGALYYSRDWRNNMNIDTTLEQFVIHFKNKYLMGLPIQAESDTRSLIKHSLDIYRSKGTDRSVELLFQLLFDKNARVYTPGDDVLRASDGKWYSPQYLEVSISDRTAGFIGRQITGSRSGAVALVEGVVRRSVHGKVFDVIYLSNVRGNFLFPEIVTDSGDLTDCPKTIGSLTGLTLAQTGRDFAVGDIVDVVSAKGKQGRARVASIVNATGRVDFNLLDGGYGYSLDADALVAQKTITFSNFDRKDGNTFVDAFPAFSTVVQPLNTVYYYSPNTTFAAGDTVRGRTGGTITSQGIVTATGANSLVVVLTSGSFELADDILKGTSGNTAGALVDYVADTTATGTVVGSNATAFGLISVGNQFYTGPGNYVYNNSNTYVANLVAIATGSSASFNVGTLENEEVIFINTDFLNSNNTYDAKYMGIKMSGGNSGYGYIESVGVVSGGTGYTNSSVVYFTGGGRTVGNVTITAAGSGYVNGQTLYFSSSTGNGAAGIIVTNSSGNIVSVTLSSSGNNYVTAPTIRVRNTTGVGAILTANMQPATPATANVVAVGGVIQTVNLTDLGEGYFSKPTITVSGGTGANLQANMFFGYGFPAFPEADLYTPINQALTRENLTIGKVSALANVNPGTNYNADPFTLLIEPTIAHFDRRDLLLTFTGSSTKTFVQGETVEQGVTVPAYTIALSASGNYKIGESALQIHSNTATTGTWSLGSTTMTVASNTNVVYNAVVTATGIPVGTRVIDVVGTTVTISNPATAAGTGAAVRFVDFASGLVTATAISGGSGTIRVRNVVGAFDAANTVKGLNSGRVGTVSNVTANNILAVSKGEVITQPNTSTLQIKRTSFATSFENDVVVYGSLSGAQATVASVTEIVDSLAIGNNAIVTAKAGNANGTIGSLDIVDSGFAYENNELVTLTMPDNIYVATARTNFLRQGIGEGFWLNEDGFLNNKYIHDGFYYQDYSYEVRVGIALERYSKILKDTIHLSGVNLFGSYDKETVANVAIVPVGSTITLSTP